MPFTEAREPEDQEGRTLDDYLEDYESELAEAEAEAEKLDPKDLEKARKLAEKINGSFLWVVNRTQCPHVPIDKVIDRAEGDEAFQALAERWGGEVPEWLQRFEPYVAAGVYMGTAIVTARQAEAQVMEIMSRQQAQKKGGGDGQEPQH